MRRDAWRAVMRRDGHRVMAGHVIVATCDDYALAKAIAALPDLLDLLADAEDYFGDRPRSDAAALELHERLVEVLARTGTRMRSAD